MAIASHHAAPEVEREVAEHVRRMNNSRRTQPTPEIYRQASEQNKLYIFNVGPWSHKRELGSIGSVTIPACLEGQEYSEPIVIPGVAEEPYPINEQENKVLITEAPDLANQILGEGPFAAPRSSFVPFGCFVSATKAPTKKDLDLARQKLGQKYVEIIAEANEAWANGATAARDTIRPEWHFTAARILKKSEAECPWLGTAKAPAERKNCPGCGQVYDVGIVRHSCGWIFDHAKWKANQMGAAS